MMRLSILLEGGAAIPSGGDGGLFFFGLFLISLVLGIFILLLAVVMDAFRTPDKQKSPDPNIKRLKKIGLISLLVAVCSALLTAVFCSGI